MLVDDDGFLFVNANGDALALNDFIYPFTKGLDIELNDERSETRPKPQDHGQWPTYQYHGGMEITAEGDMFGDDSAGYIASRKFMMEILRFVPDVRSPVLGQVKIKWVDETEYWVADVDKIAITAPLVPSSPSRSAYQIIFHCPSPFFTGEDTDSIYYWS